MSSPKPAAFNQTYLFLAFLLVMGCSYFASMHGYMVGFLFDDGVYVLGSLGLAIGQGYTLPFVEGQPPVISYPPLMSALLAPLWHLHSDFPANIPLLQCLPIGSALATLYLAWRWFQVGCGLSLKWAWALVVILAFNAGFWQYCTPLMSEPLFLMLSYATILWCVRLQKEHNPTSVSWVVLMALSLLCAYTRTLGLTIMGAVFLALLFSPKEQSVGRSKMAWLYAALMALGLLPWFLHTANVQANHPFFQTHTYPDFLIYPYIQSYFQHYSLQVQSVGVVPFVLGNLWHLAAAWGSLWIPTEMPGPEWVVRVGQMVMALFSLGVIVKRFALAIYEKKGDLPTFYVFLTLLACVAWYDTQQYGRFLLMILPIVMAWLAIDLKSIFAKLNVSATKARLILTSGYIILMMIWVHASYFEQGGRAIWTTKGPAYAQLLKLIQEKSTPQDRIYSRYYSLFPLYAHRNSMAYNHIFLKPTDEQTKEGKARWFAMEVEKFKILRPTLLVTEEASTLVKLFPTLFHQEAAVPIENPLSNTRTLYFYRVAVPTAANGTN